ncbi:MULTISPECIES: DUF1697 domain-containing protein [unclassified Leeuwenhoekiella]|uniref:DUF1697 domain-containing protein n=1 Tax=unclassified Leeuwenhoekiella TaxID=2615029 RepID=UPI000C68D496|nr:MULTISPECIES: DUF1697 domain-containing protein [unclassified Leeuwenhoekiella]MAW94150.1 hypothetical protein [Leeuwenhoekiella sp.]MBA82447.1 hypothetical protein [Leeuwenhoekiella sp.]
MPKTIALLRGINVGGHRIIKMADLKKLMNGLGFKKVITYIQSGNILFDSPAKAKYDEIADRIKRGIQTQFGFDVPVVVLDAKKLEEAVAQNPFKDADLSQLHITFLSEEPAVAKQNNIKTVDFTPDAFAIQGSFIFLKIDGSYHKTKFSNAFFEKKLDRTATTRNWKTVLKLLELSKNELN